MYIFNPLPRQPPSFDVDYVDIKNYFGYHPHPFFFFLPPPMKLFDEDEPGRHEKNSGSETGGVRLDDVDVSRE